MNPNDTNQPTYLPDDAIVELYWQREETAISATDQKYGNTCTLSLITSSKIVLIARNASMTHI